MMNNNSMTQYQGQNSQNQNIDKISQLGASLNQNQRNQQNDTTQGNMPQQSQTQNVTQVPSMNPNQMIGSQSSEQHLSTLKEQFISSANTLTAFYKHSCNAFDLAYQQGKQDAYEDVFSWFMSQGQDGQFKHVQVNQFNNFMMTRLKTQGMENSIPDDQMMPPPANRPQKKYQNEQILQNRTQQSEVGAQPSSQELIQMAANQVLKEEPNTNPLSLSKKVNTQIFQNIKFQENKKRVMRPSNQAVQFTNYHQNDENSQDQNQEYENDQIMEQMNSDQNENQDYQNTGFNQNQNQLQADREFQRIKRRNIQNRQNEEK